MGNRPNDDDLLRLNALVDGELGPAERAEVAGRLAVDRDLARAYAVLAQLKATVADVADETPVKSFPKTRRPLPWRLIAAAACVVFALGLGVLGARMFWLDAAYEVASAEGPTAITLASLPDGTSIPRLDTAGLTLVGLAITPDKIPLMTAIYRGPRGCLLDLRAWPDGAEPPFVSGTSRHRWRAGDLVYEVVAHGMPQWRFSMIAEAAEQQTQGVSDQRRAERLLREAKIGAPPCQG